MSKKKKSDGYGGLVSRRDQDIVTRLLAYKKWLKTTGHQPEPLEPLINDVIEIITNLQEKS